MFLKKATVPQEKVCFPLLDGTKTKAGVRNTDAAVMYIYTHLLRDFRSVSGESLLEGYEFILHRSVAEFRALTYPGLMGLNAYLFKQVVQIRDLLGRYKFEHDVYTKEDLKDLSVQKYLAFQEQLCNPREKTVLGFLVKQEARRIITEILGEFQESDVAENAQFGKKSSIGCPMALAHIDWKLSNVKAFTGSFRIAKWFMKEVVHQDDLLRRFLQKVLGGDPTASISEGDYEFLVMKFVPKKWNIDRGITPLALLNLFYSYGIAELATVKLKEYGLDIRHLQDKHRKYAKKFSVPNHLGFLTHVTADLTMASECITTDLLNSLLPRKWYVALKPILTHQVELEQKMYYTASVLPMGNAATFPFETLIFYSIIRAIGNLTHVKGIYSVYGDDLIYPSKLHKYVLRIFPELGFSLNSSKTFVHVPFRESCGADYFHGVDVRPFSFRGECQVLSPSQYTAWLYKAYNGLRLRWLECEIPKTLAWILTEISQNSKAIARVPPSYPATAGVQTSSPDVVPLGSLMLYNWAPIQQMFAYGSSWIRFWYLQEKAPRRFVLHIEPYLWLSLQRKNDVVEDEEVYKRKRLDTPISMQANPFWKELASRQTLTPEVRWTKIVKYRFYFDKTTGRRVKKKIERWAPFVSEKLQTQLVQSRPSLGSISDWV